MKQLTTLLHSVLAVKNNKMAKKITLEDIPILKLKHVHMKDKAEVLEKINNIIKDGANKLQVVTDFDYTLTKQHNEGALMLSSFGIFQKSRQLPKSYKDNNTALYNKYRPIEIDPNMSIEEKIIAMNEWNELTHKCHQDLKFDCEEIKTLVNLYGNSLRDRTQELFEKLKNQDVPILVFSAGLGDIVKELLRQQNVLFKNVKIISNFLKFNGEMLEGFKNYPQMIHVFNKNEHAIENEYFRILQGRTNVVLMGDTTGDALMADNVDNIETILRIGFLYDHAEESLPQFKEAFDIVLVDDQTMNVVLDILNPIFD